MSISQVLETALGLALIYYLLGLVVSWISKIVMDVFETRGRALESYLKRIVGGKSLGQLVSMPQIRSLAPVRFPGWLGVFTPGLKLVEKKVEKVPVSNLVDAFFDLTKIDVNATGEELLAAINKLPISEGKTEMLRLVNSGVTHASDLRAKMGLWFDGLLDQASAQFKALARRYVILFSLALTLILGVDSIDLFKQLWASPDMRAIAAVKAQAYIAQNGYAADTGPLLADLDQFNVKIGWDSLTKNMPDPLYLQDFVKFWFWKAIGLLMTTVAVSQGSSFWYDILRKLTDAKAAESSSTSTSSSEESQASSTSSGPDATGAYG